MVKNVSVSFTPNRTSSTDIHIPDCNQNNNAMESVTPLPVCDDMRVSQRCLCLIMHVQMDKLHDPRVLFHMYTAK